MKHGSIKAVCLVVLVCIAVLSAYGDERTVDLNSIILEDFNGDTTHEWVEGRRPRTFEFSWDIMASKFASKTEDENGNEVNYPIMGYINAWPMALFGYSRDERDIKSLGINGSFDRRGYNWMDIYPVADGEPFEIPLPGRVQYLDLWVWSPNLDYQVEAYVRDHQGAVHMIKLGSIAHTGWKNMRANIPSHVHQAKRILPNLAQLKFVKFRIWTMPQENVNNFYIYFKQFKVLTDSFESIFDGDELADPDRIPDLWANSTGTN